MAAVDLETGSTFAGRYRVLGRLASGGMGTVYEVLHLETRRRRALKVMLPELFQKPELRDRFRREAHVTASVKSEFLVDVFDAGVDAQGTPFLVMELLEGQDLGRLVDRSGPLSPSDVVEYLAQVASALDRTHAASVVHRDLKPENLFLTHREDGSACIKILDFGISKVVNEAATGGKNTTSIGTPAYMAPEQIVGGPVTPAADLHALGLIAFTLLTGRAYWQDDVESTDNALAFALRAAQGIREGAVSRARRHGHSLPNEFDAWFGQAVELDPSRRFKSASESVRGLAVALGFPIPELLAAGRAGAPRAGSGRGAGGGGPILSETEQVASTMHGAELGPAHRKPGTLVRWLAAGAAVGILGVGIATFATRGHGDSAPSGQSASSDLASASPQQGASAQALIVAPVGDAIGTIADLPPPRGTDAANVTAQGAPASSTRAKDLPTPHAAPKQPPAASAPKPSASIASPPPAATPGATASFPTASARPKVKYTRD